jgi:hypothetical protein
MARDTSEGLADALLAVGALAGAVCDRLDGVRRTRARKKQWRRSTKPKTKPRQSKPPKRSPMTTVRNGPKRSRKSATTSTCCLRSTATRPSIGCICAPQIESTFATVRLRTRVTKGPGSRAAGVALAFKLIESAQARCRAVNAPQLVALVRAGAEFKNGDLVERPDEQPETTAA